MNAWNFLRASCSLRYTVASGQPKIPASSTPPCPSSSYRTNASRSSALSWLKPACSKRSARPGWCSSHTTSALISSARSWRMRLAKRAFSRERRACVTAKRQSHVLIAASPRNLSSERNAWRNTSCTARRAPRARHRAAARNSRCCARSVSTAKPRPPRRPLRSAIRLPPWAASGITESSDPANLRSR